MAVTSTPTPARVPERRFPRARLLLRFVALVAVPIVVFGGALWWLVGNDRVQRAVELQASENHRVVDLTIGELLETAPGAMRGLTTVVVSDPQGLAQVRADTVTPLVGEHRLRILDASGKVVFSDDPTEVGSTVELSRSDRDALQGVPAGARSDDGSRSVDYSLPWAPDGGSTSAVVDLTVLDDGSVAATVDDVADLGFLFGGAFLGLLIALGPMCWWALGQVRRQLSRTRVLAMNDALTGLPNRIQFQDRLDEAIAAAQRTSGLVGLVMVDLDGFKAINDTGGHAAGDRLLKRVAASLREATRRNEIPCRLGGDEFAVLVPRLRTRQELVALADRLHEYLDLAVAFSDGRSLRVTASMGLSVYPQDAPTADALMDVADVGMYSVKAARRAKRPQPVVDVPSPG